ncbi:MAG: glycosyltransferase family 4 protein [Patescibacteria group bacterium]
MKILICTGIYPPDVGGPATYAKNLVNEFLHRGNKVKVIQYGIEKKLPIGVRHCFYFFKVIFNILGTDLIIALDTFSVGWPAVCVAKIFRKKIIVRVGGDFLWEGYVEQSGNLITLKDFNENLPKLSLKQKIIFRLTKFVLNNSKVVFSTEWQKRIWEKAYGLKQGTSSVIENYYGEKLKSNEAERKDFLWAGRPIKLKNVELLKEVFEGIDPEIELDVTEKIPGEELVEKIKNCYAVILPSLSEVSPNFILEAVRYGKPFICTKETGLREKLENVGLFIDPLDKEDIRRKVIYLTDSDNYAEYKRKVGMFGFIHSWQEIVDEFLRFF